VARAAAAGVPPSDVPCFEVVGFPCNQFGGQAPGTSDEERAYAWRKFGFEFPVYDKVDVNGRNACDAYRFLRVNQPTAIAPPKGAELPPLSKRDPDTIGPVEWNYGEPKKSSAVVVAGFSLVCSLLPRPRTFPNPPRLAAPAVKFLVTSDGRAVKRFKSGVDPLEMTDDVRLLLAGRPEPRPLECYMHPGRLVCRAEGDDLPPPLDEALGAATRL